MKIAILGGTGNEGPGLALRWAAAGHEILIGSRREEKAQRVARQLNERLRQTQVVGMSNEAAAQACEVAVLTVPYAAQNALLRTLKGPLQGKLLIVVTVALRPPKVARVYIPPQGSASEQAQEVLGDSVRVVAAFQNVGAHALETLDRPVDCDVLVCGDRKADKAIALQLAAALGTRGIDAGPLVNSKAVEAMTSVLIGINIRYHVTAAGLRITGV